MLRTSETTKRQRTVRALVAATVAVVALLFLIGPSEAGSDQRCIKHPTAKGCPEATTTTTQQPTTTTTTTSPTTTTTVPDPGSGSYPTTPPAQICGNTSILAGPSVAPLGAVRVDPGQNLNSATQQHPAGTTFWLSSGVHTLGTSEFDQVIPKDGNTYVGAPGAIIDGQRLNRYAFTQKARNVTVRHLTIRNFGPLRTNMNEGVVNHDAGDNWLIERNTITGNSGAGVFVGSGNVIRLNCLHANGQYGFSMYKPPVPGASAITNITIDRNEISNNNTDDWEAVYPDCGCTGGGKFWDVGGATIVSNWVHHNKSVGLWADTNNIGFRFEGNYINDNDAEGIFYEVSYNALVKNNTLIRNAIVKGKKFAARNDSFPVAAVYLSEAGGDSRVNGGVYSTLDITGNMFQDNWNGVVIWENADRFCGSPANTSSGYCTVVNPQATLTTCSDPAKISTAPYFSDCRWKSQNIKVTNNDFRVSKAAIGCTTPYCGLNAMLSNYGTYPDWSPYKGRVVQDAITFNQGNVFANNRYSAEWRFNPYETGRILDLRTWQAAPYSQDAGSTQS